MIYINTRVCLSGLTGIQRYVKELMKYLGKEVRELYPPVRFAHGSLGHVWEQVALPFIIKDNLLFSPNFSGPITITHQVVTVHDMTPFDFPDYLTKEYVLWYRFLVPRLLSNCDKIIAVSHFTKSQILKFVNIKPEKIEVIYNGVDQRFFRSNLDTSLLRNVNPKELQTPCSNYLLYVGSIQPRKNLERILKAWNLVVDKVDKDIWLIVAGTKGKSQVFKQLSLENIPPRVYFTEFVPEEALPELYKNAIGFVFPSLYEGFGLPILEAMASGTPVITSNLTAMPEIAGDAALQVDPYDIESIADGIYRIIEDHSLREYLASKGVERAKIFSWKATAEKTWKVLMETNAQF